MIALGLALCLSFSNLLKGSGIWGENGITELVEGEKKAERMLSPASIEKLSKVHKAFKRRV